MVRRKRYDCAGCDRTFLSRDQRRRHCARNPSHQTASAPNGRTESPADRQPTSASDHRTTADGSGTVANSDWIEFDDRIETFVRFDDPVDADAFEFRYRPDRGHVRVDGERRRWTIDVSGVQRAATAALQWSFDGNYLTLALLKDD